MKETKLREVQKLCNDETLPFHAILSVTFALFNNFVLLNPFSWRR